MKKKKHYCGDGFKGRVIRIARQGIGYIYFCDFCGHEFEKKKR